MKTQQSHSRCLLWTFDGKTSCTHVQENKNLNIKHYLFEIGIYFCSFFVLSKILPTKVL